MWFRLVTLPKATDTYMNLFEIGNSVVTTPKSQFTVFFRNNRLTCDFDYNETMDIGPVPVDGGWHQLQVIVFYGATSYIAEVSYDGGFAQTLTSANNKTPATVKQLFIHYPGTAVDYTMDVDDILMSTAATQPDFIGGGSPQPPPPPPPPPPISFSESFEGGAVGAQPTSANTTYDQSIGDKGDGNGTVGVVFDANGVQR